VSTLGASNIVRNFRNRALGVNGFSITSTPSDGGAELLSEYPEMNRSLVSGCEDDIA
jgi:hypothetical protein